MANALEVRLLDKYLCHGLRQCEHWPFLDFAETAIAYGYEQSQTYENNKPDTL